MVMKRAKSHGLELRARHPRREDNSPDKNSNHEGYISRTWDDNPGTGNQRGIGEG